MQSYKGHQDTVSLSVLSHSTNFPKVVREVQFPDVNYVGLIMKIVEKYGKWNVLMFWWIIWNDNDDKFGWLNGYKTIE